MKKNSPLSGLQTAFQAFLLEGGDSMTTRVLGTAKVNAETRLSVYFDAYRLRLLEALDSNYPVLHTWLGDEAFEQLGLRYLRAHPSTHFSIRYFGHQLPQFLTGAEYRDRPYLAELAAFEWAVSEAFDAQDCAVITVDDMGTVLPEAWPDMRLRMHASTHRLDLKWNMPVIWKATREYLDAERKDDACRGETSNTPSAENDTHHINRKLTDVPPPSGSDNAQAWLVWRQDFKTYFRSLSVDEAWALDALREGENFASVCEGLCEWIDPQNVAMHAAGLIKQWIIDGLVCRIETDKT